LGVLESPGVTLLPSEPNSPCMDKSSKLNKIRASDPLPSRGVSTSWSCHRIIYKSVGTTYVQQVVGYVTKKVNFRLPDELIEKADVAAEISHTNRTEIIKQALKEYLQEVENEKQFQEAVIELYLDNEIGFDTLKEFIGRQDAESVRASKNILDQGEELADELAEL
jgi:predicted transcriptional regulator